MIQCAACKAENDSRAITCATCQADLLPGVSTSERWKLFGMLGFFAVVTGGLAYFSYRISQGAVCIGIAIVLGLVAGPGSRPYGFTLGPCRSPVRP